MDDYYDDEELDTVPVLVRKMVWDILPCDEVEDIMPVLGLIAAGEDVADMEHEESHGRLDLCHPLISEIEIYSTVAADIMSKAFIEAVDKDVEPAHQSIFQEQNLMLLRGGAIAILAQLLDTGKLKYGDNL